MSNINVLAIMESLGWVYVLNIVSLIIIMKTRNSVESKDVRLKKAYSLTFIMFCVGLIISVLKNYINI